MTPPSKPTRPRDVSLRPIDPDQVAEELRPTWPSRGVDLVVGTILGGVSWSFVSVAVGVATTSTALASAAALFSGIGALHMLRRAVTGRPALEWDEDGFTDRTSLLGGELRVRWEDVKEIRTTRADAGVRIEFEDNPAFARGMGIGRRLQFLLRRVLGRPGLDINPSFLRVDYRRLAEALEQVMMESEAMELRRSKPRDLLGPAVPPRPEDADDPADPGAPAPKA